MEQTTLSVRMDTEIKKQFDDFCVQVGMNAATAVNMFARAVLREKRLPFELSAIELTENGYTPEFEAEILREAEECYAAVANGTITPFKSVAELRAALDAEEDD
ncbi:MAG: type II toxin-antitoxin system RelB/DinJ family antitoxin [Defluviitaleaceae bacterium]|nr:type II toxin-antitoxin system RelB/DinJ family antitoxin [Defluviitaleaceae bacterium]